MHVLPGGLLDVFVNVDFDQLSLSLSFLPYDALVLCMLFRLELSVSLHVEAKYFLLHTVM